MGGGGLVDSVFEKCRQCLTKHSQIRDIFFFKKQQQTTTDFISYSPSITLFEKLSCILCIIYKMVACLIHLHIQWGGQKCGEKNGVWTPIDLTALWTFVRDSSSLHAISFMFESRTRSYIISLRCLWLWWKHILLLVNR